MNKLVIGAMGVLVMVAAGGCATTYRVTEIRPQEPSGVQTVNLSVNPADQSAERLAGKVAGGVANRLIQRGFCVLANEDAETSVSIIVSRRETARLDEWRTYEGTANICVSACGDTNNILGFTSISADGMRSLDEVKAEKGVVDGLVRQSNAWLDRALPRITNMPRGKNSRTRLVFAPVNMRTNPREVLDAQAEFQAAVSSLPGVASCRLTSGTTMVTYDVEYEAAKFPNGFLNTLIAQLRARGFFERFKVMFRSNGLDLVP